MGINMLTSKCQEILIWFNNSQQQSTEVLEEGGEGRSTYKNLFKGFTVLICLFNTGSFY